MRARELDPLRLPAGQPSGGGDRVARTQVLLPVLCAVAVLVAVALRLHAASQLWLDEALSVDIARLPRPQLLAALRDDGAPPLYYLLLHSWMGLFGSGNTAVRALSGVVSVAQLPAAYAAGRAVHSRSAGWAAVLLLGADPFAVRYATETRMYALVVLLVLLGVVALARALTRPSALSLAGVAVVTGALLLTHYWALFLVAAVGGVLLARALPAGRRSAPVLCLAAMGVGALAFLPWLATFRFQARHTGTPWATAPSLSGVPQTVLGWCGTSLPGWSLFLGLLALLTLAVVGRGSGPVVVLRLPVRPAGCDLVLVTVATLFLGIGVSAWRHEGFAERYSAVALAPALVAAAIGAAVLPRRARLTLLTVCTVAGLVASAPLPFTTDRTQAGITAAALRARLRPGSLVVYCPDQLGPAVSRLLPPGVPQVVYPTLGSPQLIDWVDYAARNARAHPLALARTISSRARGVVELVTAARYRTFGDQCAVLDAALARLRHGRTVVSVSSGRYEEHQTLVEYPAPTRRHGTPAAAVAIARRRPEGQPG